MQELDEFLNKQRDLTMVMLENLLAQQSLLHHNLSIGLSSLKQLNDSLPDSEKQIKKSHKQTYIQTLYKNYDISGEIVLESDLPELFSKTTFSLAISIRSLSTTFLEEQEIPVELRMYTNEKFPRRIITNQKGKPIIQGKTNAKVKGLHKFILAITEPSSNYPTGQFTIVMYSENSEIKPLILERIVVKRKIK